MALNRHEDSKINDAEDAAGRAQRQGTELRGEIHHLRDKVAKLSMTCQALWELLRDRTKLTEEDLQRKVASVEESLAEPLACPQCGRAVSRKKNDRCMFCGIQAKSDRIFDV